MLIHTFEHLVSGIVEVEPDVFIVNLSDASASHESHLARVDLTGWTPGGPSRRRLSIPSTTVSAHSTAAAKSAPA